MSRRFPSAQVQTASGNHQNFGRQNEDDTVTQNRDFIHTVLYSKAIDWLSLKEYRSNLRPSTQYIATSAVQRSSTRPEIYFLVEGLQYGWEG
jgi:hypothetical protein